MSGRTKRPTDAEIVDALRAHGGNAMRAAAALGIPCMTLKHRSARIPEAEVLRCDRRHTTKPRRHSDEEIAEAYARLGSYAAAGRALGYCGEAVRLRMLAIGGAR